MFQLLDGDYPFLTPRLLCISFPAETLLYTVTVELLYLLTDIFEEVEELYRSLFVREVISQLST